ncbi:hypothetical protein G7077_09245 [Sphingomonas piscis]|uniref:Uncharacterized protein n=1 Tax=Sphingomonas piscis TaxID=2714943 RepID=A0A6G7YQN7_9SPHN|nr:hypothetical protein [Sphingomonas piscis]QIK79049.1 hypothetical protein G7077_09245 [Sphingomonas piscis]
MTSRRLVFARPFMLGKAPEVYPAGTYEVETREEAWEAQGHRALRRTSTVLVVPTPTGTLHRQVSGTELDQAFARDAEEAATDGINENPDIGHADGEQDEAPR